MNVLLDAAVKHAGVLTNAPQAGTRHHARTILGIVRETSTRNRLGPSIDALSPYSVSSAVHPPPRLLSYSRVTSGILEMSHAALDAW